MSSPPVNIPHKETSGGQRRSALTSAFEELALFADQKTDEGEAFSAHVSVDRTLIPSVVVGGDGRELRGPCFKSRSLRARDHAAADVESASFGRQHGSFSAISFLQASVEDLSPSLSNLSAEEDGSLSCEKAPERAAPFEFNGGNSEFTSAEPNEMSFMWNSLEGTDAAAPASPLERDVLRKTSPKTSPDRRVVGQNASFNSINNTVTGTQSIPPRVVVVHVGNDDDENSCASAGRKQRGSFSSLLLLEAHELSTLDSSPTAHKQRLMQSHIDDERIASMRVSA